MRHARVCLPLIVILFATIALPVPLNSQWSHTNGSQGGFAVALGNSPDCLFIGIETGGIYRSTNDGGTWQGVFIGLSGSDPGGYAFEALGTKVLVSSGFSIYASTDGGFTWVLSSTGLPQYGAWVAGFAVRGGAIFAGTGTNGVYRSLDSGATWSKTVSAPADSHATAILSNGQFLLIGTETGGVFRSSDEGSSWQAASTGLGAGDGMRILSLAAQSGTLIVGTREGAYHSTDNGDHWTLATSGLTSMSVPSLIALGSDFLAGTHGGGVYRSTNNGVDWNWSSTGLEGGNVWAFCARGSMTFAACYGIHPLYRSSDQGATWTPIGSGITSEALSAIAGSDTRVFAGAFGGLHITTDGGDSWTTPPLLSEKDIAALGMKGGVILAGSSNDGPYISSDEGETWSAAGGGLISSDSRRTTAITADSVAWYAGTWGGVYRSTNDGVLWVRTSNGLADSTVMSLCAANGRLFAGTHTGLYVSTNSGAQWTPLTQGLPLYRVNSIVNLNGVIMVAFGLGGNPSVFKSTDGGLSWTPVSNGLSGGAVIQTLCVYGNSVFGGTISNGVWLSTNAGEEWTNISEGLSGPALKVAALTTSGGFLYSGARRGGIWSRPLSQVVSVEDGTSGAMIENFRLSQNYPNPFNGETRIGYSVQKMGDGRDITLKVFDILGREVAVLAGGSAVPGDHSVVFDASEIPSGVYFCRLTAGSYVTSMKMLLLR